MRYFICPEDTDCIPCIEAEDLEEAKEKMCAGENPLAGKELMTWVNSFVCEHQQMSLF